MIRTYKIYAIDKTFESGIKLTEIADKDSDGDLFSSNIFAESELCKLEEQDKLEPGVEYVILPVYKVGEFEFQMPWVAKDIDGRIEYVRSKQATHIPYHTESSTPGFAGKIEIERIEGDFLIPLFKQKPDQP